ncbi:MAG: hypothetical protein KY054_03035 [Candidatus Nealsonbacteria bacterium]|nr:hypothetical protein [Candidatus Nealsonbacteria bacterium]
MEISTIDVIKVFTLGSFGFLVAFIVTPALSNFLYKHKLWKKRARDKGLDGEDIPVFRKFHSEKEVNVPRLGGLLIWTTTLFLAFFFFFLSKVTDIWWVNKLNFLSREQTWLPLFALVGASIIGVVDDLFQVMPTPKNNTINSLWKKLNKYIGGGLNLKYRLVLVGLIGLIGGLWFYFKLEQSMIYVPGFGSVFIGIWYIPLFIIVMMATYSGGVIDGLDGLAGGAFASIFGAFTVIALSQSQFDLAAFSAVIMGTILAFLWFNIPPARFYMGETGIIGLCAAVTVIAFLTNSVLVLPIIGFLLVMESGSVIIQVLSKKIFKRKVFLAAPIHHHFEAMQWPHYKVTMRFWIIGIIMAIIGVTIKLLG